MAKRVKIRARRVPPTQDEISQIILEHHEAVKASQGSLEHAIKCGQKLEAAGLQKTVPRSAPEPHVCTCGWQLTNRSLKK